MKGSGIINQENDYEIKRGEIYFLDLCGIETDEYCMGGKNRPGLIVQNNTGNGLSQSVIVALLTSVEKKFYPFQYKFVLNGKENTIMYDKILTISKDKIGRKIGELSQKQLIAADAALMCSLGLSHFYMPNISEFDIKSIITEVTKENETTYYVFELTYHNGIKTQSMRLRLSIENAIEYDHTINKHTNINDIKHIFDCCEGLSYLVNNAERI